MTYISKAASRYAGLVVMLIAITVTSCEDFLEVQDPGRFTDEALNSPLALAAVANGAEADLMASIDDFATFDGLMSDELMHTGTWNPWEDMDQGRQGPSLGGDNNLHRDLLLHRTKAQRAQERFATVLADSADRSLLMARVVAAEGWANLIIGMHVCESPGAADGPILSDLEIIAQAIPLLTRAADIASTAGSVIYQRFATGGRARAKLLTNDLNGALADAQTIPIDFVFSAKFSETGQSNSITAFAHWTRLKAGGLDTRQQSKVDTVAGAMRDPFTNQLDQRLRFTRQGNGADNVKKFYNQEKYTTLSDDVPMLKGTEMRLIEAEVHMKQGRLPEAVAAINLVRTRAGLTPHATTGLTAAIVQDYLLWERFAELYLEGHRMHDLARFNLVPSVLGTGRAPKFAMDDDELLLNPNTLGNTVGRCPAML